MAAQMAKDGVIRARAVQWACAIALVAALPAAESSGQQSYYQQQQAFQQQQQQQAYLQQAQGYAQQQQQQEQQRRQQQESQLQQQKQQIWEDQQQQYEDQQARNRQDEELYRQARMRDEESQRQYDEAAKRRRDQEEWSTYPSIEADSSSPTSAASDLSIGATQNSTPDNGFQSADVSPAGEEPVSSGIRLLVLGGIAATGLTLLGLIVGAIVTLTAVRRKGGATIDNAQDSSELSAPAAMQTSYDRVRSGIETAVNNFRILFRRALRRGRRLAGRMVPSRRFLARSAFLLFGTGLVLVSLVGFANGQVLISFIILPIGYAIATCFWLLPWNSTRSVSGNQLSAITAPTPAPVHAPPRPAATRPHLARAAKPASGNLKSTVDFESKPEAVRPYHAAHHGHKPEPFTTATRVQLVCIPCGKQYDVRGEGNIGVRLIPCPQCGSALAAIGAQKVDPIVNDPSWVPIVSVLCKNCRGLIDVPYSTIGTSVACPRCQAALPVPRVAGHIKQELAQDCFA
jgi:flagellar motor protein MotB